MAAEVAANEKDFSTSDSLAEKAAAILDFGSLLLACGAGGYRVKSCLARAAKALGLTKYESHISMKHITATAWENEKNHTQYTEQRQVGVNVEKLDRLMVFSEKLRPGMTVADFRSTLKQLSADDWHYRRWVTVFFAAIACAAFCFLNGGYVVECSAVFFAAGVGQYVRKIMLRRNYAHFLVWIVCAIVSTLLYIGILNCYEYFQLAGVYMHEAGIISSILYLIPGFPLTTAMLDLVRGDYQSAITRFSYCILVIGSAGLSVWLVCHFADWNVANPPNHLIDPALRNALRILCSFIAAYGFAVLFNAPWKVAAAAAGVGAFANAGRIIVLQECLDIPWQVSVGMAALVIGILSTFIAWKTAHSRVSLSVPAVVIMIPGVPFYRALVAANEGNVLDALSSLAEVFFVVMAIGFGLALARTILDPAWRMDIDTSTLPDSLEQKNFQSV